MTTLQKHNVEIAERNYSGVVTDFSGYVQFGKISGRANHDLIGFTPELIRRCVEIIQSPNYAYSRQKNHGINIYGRDEKSPTGVSLIGGIPDELEFLLYAFGKTGQLSPTEDLRTAR